MDISERKGLREARAWLPHRLQMLPVRRFGQVVDRVLRGEDEIIKLVPKGSSSECVSSKGRIG